MDQREKDAWTLMDFHTEDSSFDLKAPSQGFKLYQVKESSQGTLQPYYYAFLPRLGQFIGKYFYLFFWVFFS